VQARREHVNGMPARHTLIGSGVSVALALALAGCGSGSPAPKDSDRTARDRAAAGAVGTPARRSFSNPTRIDNRWLPLAPGTQFVLRGRSNRGHGLRRHRVVFTVTDLTKVIDGVQTLVLWDRDYNGGELLEAELTFHAQDDAGTVWNFGEYPEEHEGGKVSGAPDTWIAGLAGARAGIAMRADPRVGTPAYRQGWAPKIEFGDKGRVFKTGQRDCVPFGCFDNVLVTDETNPFEPTDGHQRKYYAAGVGTIRAAPVGGKEHEVLVLTRVAHLSGSALAKARAEAVKLDRRAYSVSRDVYRHTRPIDAAQRAPSTP
jgi:hypothetical protein